MDNYQQYIESTGLNLQIKDIARHLLRKGQVDLDDTLNDYVIKWLKGEHVQTKNYEYVKETIYNRLCFARNIRQIFYRSESTKQLSCEDFYQLTNLLCNDFPREYTNSVEEFLRRQSVIAANGLTEFDLCYLLFAVFFIFEDFVKTLKELLVKKGGIGRGGAKREVLQLLSASLPPRECYLWPYHPFNIIEHSSLGPEMFDIQNIDEFYKIIIKSPEFMEAMCNSPSQYEEETQLIEELLDIFNFDERSLLKPKHPSKAKKKSQTEFSNEQVTLPFLNQSAYHLPCPQMCSIYSRVSFYWIFFWFFFWEISFIHLFL
eukprot:TRINITY_DN5543_c0_g1_i6.p1 TRINITY_DN5543_c0_g1~~TRINITY_DN5543_c0_g1_i6.p1  ORF type:complete len:317 (-),score=9.36 TRINITY_DN5543_c0_g1_i6:4-954(-)